MFKTLNPTHPAAAAAAAAPVSADPASRVQGALSQPLSLLAAVEDGVFSETLPTEVLGIPVTSDDFSRLHPHFGESKSDWLNENVIDAAMAVLNRDKVKSYFTSSYFYTKLTRMMTEKVGPGQFRNTGVEGGYSFDDVSSWFKKKDLGCFDRIFIPVHRPRHWSSFDFVVGGLVVYGIRCVGVTVVCVCLCVHVSLILIVCVHRL
jgi:hypothetical protein